MAYQQLVKTRLSWVDKVQHFAAQHGPFTTTWDAYRSFTIVEGFLEVRWPQMKSDRPPLIELDEKPFCAACGSKRPMFLRILTDLNGATHMVGQECYGRLCEMKFVKHDGFASQYFHSED